MSTNLSGNSFDLNCLPDEGLCNESVNLTLSLPTVSASIVDPPLQPAQTAPQAACNSVIDVDASDDDDVELIPPPIVQSQLHEDNVAYGGISRSPVSNTRDRTGRRCKRKRETVLVVDVESNDYISANIRGSALGDIGTVVPTPSNQMIGVNTQCGIDSGVKYFTVDLHSSKRRQLLNGEQEEKKPDKPSFKCPICLNSLVDPSSTICGHIFCQDCVKRAVKISKKCPTCRRKLTMNNFHRVYLPTAR